MDDRVRLGVSSCLLGERVRYDGQHKLDRYVRDILGPYVDFVPVCPEVECGFPVPRPSFRLIGDEAAPRLVVTKSGEDVTERMLAWARRRVDELAGEGLSGFVFKSDSPSSGMERVKVYNEHGMARRSGVGLFARTFMERFPALPVEEEGRLHDLGLRESFVERVFAAKRWQDFLQADPSLAGLIRFHGTHKLQIMAHSPSHYRSLGRQVAEGRQQAFGELLGAYEHGFAEALRVRATRARNANVLYHIMGFFKRTLDSDAKEELTQHIERYRTGVTTLVVPLTLLNHYVRRLGNEYLREQTYLQPHPFELQLRNHP
ncbi:MAG: DUF523 and DUF1722 domain-containing protein [Lentisphaeria bacterium]|nr:DUF523 and DUF1722 domain-containing protein [Lentisphaeria bacterium]